MITLSTHLPCGRDRRTRGCRARVALLAFLACSVSSAPAEARQTRGEVQRTGLEVRGLPAINYDADEGLGYGVLAELYQYGDGSHPPYRWTLQPTLFLTTGGRRDLVVFFDGPGVLPRRWRIGAYAGYQRQIATPYYGSGNDTGYDPSLEDDTGPNPYWYRFGRVRTSVSATVQRRLGSTALRVLAGAGVERVRVTPVPRGRGTTLFADDRGAAESRYWANFLRAGLVRDTRDRETGPRRGSWTEVLVWWVDGALGADFDATRWTVTDRRYFSFTDRLVFAHRWALQGSTGGAPVPELFRLQSSFKEQEGLGGAKTVRGVLRNRFVGRGMLVWNMELRWHAADFTLLGRDLHATVSVFLDQGRVWSEGVRPGEIFRDLHRGYGGGVRLGMGENFVVALDVGTSAETGAPMYIGLGYLY